jgi:hypothetical protein
MSAEGEEILEERIKELEAQLEELKAASKWIPVSERLPEPDVNVLVYLGEGIDLELDYIDVEVDFGTHYFSNHGEGVIKWKPITPPEGSKDDD